MPGTFVEGKSMFFELLKVIFIGIVEGITEWLPISSTGHMLLVDQFAKLDADQNFKDMFFVVIQLGAILAVVYMYWSKLWPFRLVKDDKIPTVVDSKGRTNLERMRQGLAPQDTNGISYELHHVGQKKDGTLAILSRSEHDNPALHGFLERTEAHAAGTNWDAERQAFWKAFAELVG